MIVSNVSHSGSATERHFLRQSDQILHEEIRNFSCKCKAIPVTGGGVAYGCEMPSLPHFLDNRLTDGSEVVSFMRWPPFNPQEDSWYSFLLEAESTPGS
jgi:hypothetical protein